MNTIRRENVMNLKAMLGPIVIVAMVVLFTAQNAPAQVDWMYQGLAVPPGGPGSWDEANRQLGEVVFDGATYHMYMTGGGTHLSWESSWKVGHWTSTSLDGPWTADPNNPVVVPDPGQWDAWTIYNVAVRYDGSGFRMWYGATGSYLGDVYVGLATSPDGSTWTKDGGNPLPGLVPGAPGSWDDGGMSPYTVLFDGSTYGMWTTAVKENASYGTWRIGYAWSTDGINWTKHPDPLLVGTEPWEGDNVYFPVVVPVGDSFAMWYSGLTPGYASIGYAISPDGLSWGKHAANPVLQPESPCDVVDSLAVIFDGDTIRGWTDHCYDTTHVTSPFELLFFDDLETADMTIWGGSAP
jgi:hypothetical protein